MAIARIDYCKQRDTSPPHEFGAIAAQVVNNVMAEVFSIPMSENYVVAQAHARQDLLHNPESVSPERLTSIVLIQITLNSGRSAELKATFYDALTDSLGKALNVPPADVFINLVEVAKENWSFGRST
jgi:phenylpyruvate tautomerase PptA (4-oxalocrotonate tautomerase family)